MKCLSCGAANPDGKKFCGKCGTPLPVRCTTCGAENPPGKKFCADCGAALTIRAPSGPAEAISPLAPAPMSSAERQQLEAWIAKLGSWSSALDALGGRNRLHLESFQQILKVQ